MNISEVFSPLRLVLGLTHGQGQELFGSSEDRLAAVGWAGFLDFRFMLDSLGALLLATVLGTLIGYHPVTPRTVDTMEEADMPKVYILFAFIGAVIGVTVREFGMVIGVVVFGIGGLLRFRTTTVNSTRDTGRLIVASLIGLIAGLGLPHLSVMTAVFAFVLIYLFDSKPACRVKIEQVPEGRLADAALAYRGLLEGKGCKIISERSAFGKRRIEFVFRLPRAHTRGEVHDALGAAPADLRGELSWEVD